MAKVRRVYDPVPYEPADIQAFQMLASGECPPHLQKRALDFMINGACATYDQSYCENTHDTAFKEGRRFAGNTIVKMLKLNAKTMRSENEPSETV
jgi:hypothetical protein